MSDKALMPAPNVLYATGNSVTRYRPAFTGLHVFNLPNEGRRVEVNDDGHVIIFDFTAAQARHLAECLTGLPPR